MKIDRLYTLSQFVELQQEIIKEKSNVYSHKDINSKTVDRYNDETIYAYGRIKRYNYFLKQPLTKDMFVNPIIKPVSNFDLDDIELLQFKEWQESEKKVIFEGFKNSQYYAFNCHNDKIRVNFSNSDYIRYESMFTDDNKIIKNLYDLAEKTNGELKLKNFEI